MWGVCAFLGTIIIWIYTRVKECTNYGIGTVTICQYHEINKLN